MPASPTGWERSLLRPIEHGLTGARPGNAPASSSATGSPRTEATGVLAGLPPRRNTGSPRPAPATGIDQGYLQAAQPPQPDSAPAMVELRTQQTALARSPIADLPGALQHDRVNAPDDPHELLLQERWSDAQARPAAGVITGAAAVANVPQRALERDRDLLQAYCTTALDNGANEKTVRNHRMLLTKFVSWMRTEGLAGADAVLAPDFDQASVVARFRAHVARAHVGPATRVEPNINGAVTAFRTGRVWVRESVSWLKALEEPDRKLLRAYRTTALANGSNENTASAYQMYLAKLVHWMRTEGLGGADALLAPDFDQAGVVARFRDFEGPPTATGDNINAAVTAFRTGRTGGGPLLKELGERDRELLWAYCTTALANGSNKNTVRAYQTYLAKLVHWMRTEGLGGADALLAPDFDQAGVVARFRDFEGPPTVTADNINAAVTAFRTGRTSVPVLEELGEWDKNFLKAYRTTALANGINEKTVRNHLPQLVKLVTWMRAEGLGGADALLAPGFDQASMVAGFRAHVGHDTDTGTKINGAVTALRKRKLDILRILGRQT